MLTGDRSPIRAFESGKRKGTPKRSGGGSYRKKRKKWLPILLVVVLVLIAAAVVYVSTPYGPSAEARAALQGDDGVAVSQTDDWIEFEPIETEAAGAVKQPGVIFYPGGRVKAEAYAAFARELAETGRHVFIAKMPLNFAFLGQNEADKIVDAYPDERFVIGGHSLGGPFAARYAAEHKTDIAGIFFLASYAESKGDLSGTSMPALSITASGDEVLNRESYETGRAYLPAGARHEEIKGGNHGQFGSYGEQGGDGPASISGAEQRKQTVTLLAAWLDGIKPAQTAK
ncbi:MULTISPECIES: alpha/beta fold hydrolase [Saccharibacillus]|uniref:alpha/beta fold hydrolase n=1 Tax=Saccharibacillus TaxID=456492 RepID=UPI001239BD9C|nr:alpha/beta fold hydrolase [Saccharibacillus sp. WB 17]MWJ33661.1 alpha/beta fold hydrolase [Saccharibacillus sp. WB 17]